MVLVRPLSVRWTVTFAPATTAFDGSVTTPLRVAPPISDCANRHPPWSRTVMITIETTIFFITGIVSFLLLEHRAQRDLSATSIGAIRAGRRRTAGPVGRNVAERRTTQAVFVRTAARVVLPIKYVESFKSEITGHALCEGNLLGEARIEAEDATQIEIADRLKRHAETAPAPIQRGGNESARKRIPGDRCRGRYRALRLKSGDLSRLPLVDEMW